MADQKRACWAQTLQGEEVQRLRKEVVIDWGHLGLRCFPQVPAELGTVQNLAGASSLRVGMVELPAEEALWS